MKLLRSIVIAAALTAILVFSGCSTATRSHHSGIVTAVAQLRTDDSTRIVEVQENGGRTVYRCIASTDAACALLAVGDTVGFDAYNVTTPDDSGEYMYGPVTRTPAEAS